MKHFSYKMLTEINLKRNITTILVENGFPSSQPSAVTVVSSAPANNVIAVDIWYKLVYQDDGCRLQSIELTSQTASDMKKIKHETIEFDPRSDFTILYLL